MSQYTKWPVVGGSGGGGVTSINSLTGAVTLVAGSGITITPSGSNITIASTGGGGSGTVTSVALTSPGVVYSVTGSPITTSGTFALNLIAQSANTIFSGPTTGASANPSFRALVSADIPNNAANTTGTSSNVTGVVAIANGGTGQATANAGFNALSPMTTNGDIITKTSGVPARVGIGTTGQLLTVVAGAPTWQTASPYAVQTINSTTSAVAGITYNCNTSGGAFTVTLPAPVINTFIVIKDSTGSFGTNALTLARNAGEMIEGLAASKIFQSNWGSWSIYSDGTNWFLGAF